jgi:O-methyltransferase
MAEAIIKIDKEGIEGDIVECGVWRGGGVILARLLSPNRTVWLYDTFNGMANRSQFDVSRSGYVMPEGKAAVAINEVVANLVATNTMDATHIRTVAGQVELTLTQAENIPDKIALLHLDTDWYHSTRMELEVLWPRLQRQGLLIIDDYGHWKGARKAVDEYFARRSHSRQPIDETAMLVVKHNE